MCPTSVRRLAPPLALFLAAACRTIGDPPRQAAPTTSSTVPPAAAQAKLSQSNATCSPPRQPPSARLVLERTLCFGTCPHYTLEIRGNGQAVFEGRRFVRVHGPVTGRIPQAAVDALFAKAACAHPEKWRSEYTWPVTDNPSAIVTVDLAGDGSTPIVVRDYPPCHETHDGNETPPALCELEQAIDGVFGSADYVECKAPDGGLIYCGP
jgi:hypothetical protein